MSTYDSQRGGTLIETMVALFVLAVGLLGFAGLLTNSMTFNQRAYTLSQAMFLAENLMDRMRANQDGIYTVALSQDPPAAGTDCSANSCSAAQLAAWDLDQWFTHMENSLPNGDAQISINNAAGKTEVSIVIQYNLGVGGEGIGDADALQEISSYELVSEL